MLKTRSLCNSRALRYKSVALSFAGLCQCLMVERITMLGVCAEEIWSETGSQRGWWVRLSYNNCSFNGNLPVKSHTSVSWGPHEEMLPFQSVLSQPFHHPATHSHLGAVSRMWNFGRLGNDANFCSALSFCSSFCCKYLIATLANISSYFKAAEWF